MHFLFITAISVFTYFNMALAEESARPKTKENLPDEFKQPGIVLIVSKKCKHSKKLMDFVKNNNIPHKKIYLDDDEKAKDFIIKNYNGKVPWVFKDGINLGDGYSFMEKYETEKNNQPGQTNQNKGSNLFGVDNINVRTGE